MASINNAHSDRPIDTRLKLAVAWTATMLTVVFVDLFSLYRPDIRADIEAGKISAFDIGQPFLFFSILYVVVPVVMIYLSVVLPKRVNRPANLVLAGLYMLTIVGLAIGEWNYYILGSVIEAALLAMVIRHAWNWPEFAGEASPTGSELGASSSLHA